MHQKTIIFGREAERKIPQDDVSSQHAKITYLGNNEFEIEDLNSSNGTYVNGYRIRKAIVGVNDQVRLSSGVVLDLVKEFQVQTGGVLNKDLKKSNPKDFTVEFERLKPVYEEYKRKRKQLKTKHQRKVALIRAGITLAPMSLMFMGVQGILIGLIGSTLANTLTAGYDIDEQLEEMDEQFRLRYICPNPKCQKQFGKGNSWTLLHETGYCHCGAIYNKSKLSN